MSNTILYVLAANYEDARIFAHSRGHHYSRMSNIDRREKLMGLRDVTLFVVHGAKNRKNYTDLIREARIRELQIEYVCRKLDTPVTALQPQGEHDGKRTNPTTRTGSHTQFGM